MRQARMVRAWETEQTQPKWKMHEQSKTWKISISVYGMKKRFLLVRNMAQTYESHRLQKKSLRLSKFGYSFVGFLSVYVVHVIVVRWCWCWCFWSLFVPPSVTIVPFCFSYIIWKTVQYFHSFFDAVPYYFFLFHLSFFFYFCFFPSFGVLLWVLRLELFRFDAFSTYSIRWNSKCWHVSCMFADFAHNYNAIAWKTISFRFDRVLL